MANIFNVLRYPINEAYIGKSDTLIEMENQIGAIRAKIREKGFYTDMTNLPETIRLNRLFEKQFGMDVCAIKIINSEQINAYTQMVALNFDVGLKYNDLSIFVTADKDSGFRFVPDNNFAVIINIFSGLLMNETLTDGELLAILLHELGHNFADFIYNDIEIYNRDVIRIYHDQLIGLLIYYSILAVCTLFLNPTVDSALVEVLQALFGKQFNNKKKNASERKTQKKKPSKLKGILNGLSAKINDWINYKMEVLNRLGGGKYIRNYKRQLGDKAKEENKKSPSRQNEVIADKFAGVCGYGPEIASALMKMGKIKSRAQEYISHLDKAKQDANSDYEDACRDFHEFDCHPQLVQRINSEISLLERELAKESLDPKLKKAMQDQLKELKAILKESTKVYNELSKDEKAQQLYNDYINNNCPKAVSDELEEKIEEAFDNVIKKSKKIA